MSGTLLTFIPTLLLLAGYVVGIALVFARREVLGRAATALAATGLGLLILMVFVNIVWAVAGARYLFDLSNNDIPSWLSLSDMFALYSAGHTFVTGIAVLLLVLAVFAGRFTPAPAPGARSGG